jgi:hypothetical protein
LGRQGFVAKQVRVCNASGGRRAISQNLIFARLKTDSEVAPVWP